METEFYYDNASAQIAVNFCERLLVHIKGEWAGKPFNLEPWEEKIVRDIFGWKREDGTRRYRTAFVAVPRKNGKSLLASAIALYMLIADGEPGAEIYSCAADKDQARIVFDVAKKMVEASPYLKNEATPFHSSILYPDANAVYRVLSADAPRQHGLNPHAVIFDEVHTQPNRELVDVMDTAMGARRQPLMFYITTAGYDRESICYELWEKAQRIIDGIEKDDSFYPVIYAADPDDDWTTEAVWKKANPNYGISIKPEFLEAKCAQAKQSPGYQNTFKRLYLNIWTSQETRWLPMEAWNLCGEPFSAKMLEGSACYGGLDLASSSDIASLSLVFPNEPGEEEAFFILPFFWVPGEKLLDRGFKDRVNYEFWVKEGLMTATPGNVIDYTHIIKDIEGLYERFNIKEIAFDRWGAIQMSQTLEGMGIQMIGFGQGYVSMSTPTKELLRMTLDKRIHHGGNKVLNWMADNVMVTMDAAGNVKPDKSKSRNKIDGIVATIMGLDRAIRNSQKPVLSVYETRGLELA